MITKQQNPKFLYLSRLMMIPLIFLLLFTFAVKAKTLMEKTDTPMLKLEKKYTVVLDAGHGGTDAGTVSGSIKEKDINLELAKLVYKLNKNQNIKLVLTRNSDVFMTVKEKAEAAASAGADLFISFHTYTNSPEYPSKGILAYISSRDTVNAIQNTTDASLSAKLVLPFPGEYTNMTAILILLGHSNEHLGQLIAYARSNGIKPPWSE